MSKHMHHVMKMITTACNGCTCGSWKESEEQPIVSEYEHDHDIEFDAGGNPIMHFHWMEEWMMTKVWEVVVYKDVDQEVVQDIYIYSTEAKAEQSRKLLAWEYGDETVRMYSLPLDPDIRYGQLYKFLYSKDGATAHFDVTEHRNYDIDTLKALPYFIMKDGRKPALLVTYGGGTEKEARDYTMGLWDLVQYWPKELEDLGGATGALHKATQEREVNTMKYDVVYGDRDVPQIELHFCREINDGFGNGCFGTNPNHGLTFDEAVQWVVEYHASEIERIAQVTEDEYHEYGIL